MTDQVQLMSKEIIRKIFIMRKKIRRKDLSISLLLSSLIITEVSISYHLFTSHITYKSYIYHTYSNPIRILLSSSNWYYNTIRKPSADPSPIELKFFVIPNYIWIFSGCDT